MKTIDSNEVMVGRVARYRTLKSLRTQRDPSVPLEALDLIYARELLPVIGLEHGGETPLVENTPINGAGGMTMTLARCPPGQGPDLHAHHQTYETFTVLRGRFEFRWGDAGQHMLELDEFDVISVPPRVCRAFRNVGAGEGILQVLISGGVNDMNDIDIIPSVGRRVEEIAPAFHERMVTCGITFAAGGDDSNGAISKTD